VKPFDVDTLRELVWMADAKEDVEWERTCYIVATVGNIFAEKTIQPANIHPMWEPPNTWTENTLEKRRERRGDKGRQGKR